MKKIDRALAVLFAIYAFMHVVLLLLRDETQVFWYVYTGLLLFSSLGYIFYERNITSKRLMTSIGVGLITSVIIILIYHVLLQMNIALSFTALLGELVAMGVYYKWQLIITLVVAVPLHELFMRALMQDNLSRYMYPVAAAVISSLLSALLFSYAVNIKVVAMLLIIQLVLSFSYLYTKRLITPVLGAVIAIIALIIIYGQ
ncbi:type II CAAX prenyl endopeptidase Rce1 family protein [Macrococcoides canis]|uniref:CPBP family glutamic-type intramembrane protease n=1 Tax=Macrococcoides canis TaxID=1855823 RepID=UPI0013E98FB1|nr:CPBP family glutamic-type intramembrane protease [Macrococcus canis]QIH75533.1 CPBP family intramembrane metalloprotease [Macrococcus canis]UTH12320.1 CPBP family intramembrane metalloprotease [Macrococcus canis]